MHELSIAQNIVDTVALYVPDPVSQPVKAIALRIGTQSGIAVDALVFSFSAITAETPLQGAVLDIETEPFTVGCRVCSVIAVSGSGLAVCQSCGSSETEVLGGTEMRILSIEIEDIAER